ncbi:Hypothetical protein R9X50_00280100 [Acrodontium crateriforme]|uniref:ASST-domain-containing protein n=1 Tax=Acrodontium crateriforme TaxID=150365 RepID=A0AAQ3M4L1_9PEZI|nr:Hypothetical protein R9X50_00280100 [Acrodontium crateriforme]
MNLFLLFLWHLSICLAENSTPSPPEYNEAVDNGTFGRYPVRTYATLDGITSPQINFLQWNDRCADGLSYFLTPRGLIIDSPGPMILDQYGELVWTKHFDNDFGGQAYDLRVQQYQGQDFLTFWLGDDRVRGHGAGSYYMLNASYDIVHKVDAANGKHADLHEFVVTPEGTALMTIYDIIPHDVTEFREFNSSNPEDQDPNYIWDSLFQEVDIETGNLIFEWRASDHLTLNTTYRIIGAAGTKNDPFDWFHINSIQKDEVGNYLISARYTHSMMYINGTTGDIIWTLGGKSNDFMDQSNGYALNFAWQHAARFHPTNAFPNIYNPPQERDGFTTKLITLFDNAAEDYNYDWGVDYSRGLLIEITFPTSGVESKNGLTNKSPTDMKVRSDLGGVDADKLHEVNGTNPDLTARVVKAYRNPNGVVSSSQGSVQIVPQEEHDPKVLVGYGLNAVFTEYDSNGTVLCDAHFGATDSWETGDVQSYRSYKFNWTGQPRSRPDVEISDDDAEIYVSWNGATEVSDWILQCSQINTNDEFSWSDLAIVKKDGFETTITIPEDSERYMRVIGISGERRLDHGISGLIDRGDAMSLPLLLSTQKVFSVDAVKTSISLVSAIALSLVLYELYKRYLSWRKHPGGSAFSWRNGHAYRLLNEA